MRIGASRQIFVSQAVLIVLDVCLNSTATETSVYLSLPIFNVFFQFFLNRSYSLSYFYFQLLPDHFKVYK